MRTAVSRSLANIPADGRLFHLHPPSDREDGIPRGAPPRPAPVDREDLPYKVELWDKARKAVDQVLAVTANASIGYAAYYAATREYPERYVTLRHNNNIVSRWNGPQH